MFIKNLSLALLFAGALPLYGASSYAEQLQALEEDPLSTLALSQEIEDPESREVLYHSAANGGLLVDVYKAMSKTYSRHSLWHLSPKEMPTLYKKLGSVLPRSLKANSQFFIFLSDKPVDDYAWTHSYTQKKKGGAPTQCVGIPLSREAFSSLSDKNLESLVIVRTLLGLAENQIKSIMENGRERRNKQAKAVGGTVGFITLITTLIIAMRFMGVDNFRIAHFVIHLLANVCKAGRDLEKGVGVLIAAPAAATSYLSGKGVFDAHNAYIKRTIQRIFDEYVSNIRTSADEAGLRDGYIAYHTAAHTSRTESHANTMRLINAARQYFVAHDKKESPFLRAEQNRLLEEQKQDAQRQAQFSSLTGSKVHTSLKKELLLPHVAVLNRDAEKVAKMDFF